MRKLLTMLGINKPTHTHELRLTAWLGVDNGYKKTILVKGTKEECSEHLEKLAEKGNCGVGLLLNNGGYRLVDLAEEIVRFKKEAGVELYDTLVDLLNSPISLQDKKKIEAALKKAEVDPFRYA
jgi:hypothetical protein